LPDAIKDILITYVTKMSLLTYEQDISSIIWPGTNRRSEQGGIRKSDDFCETIAARGSSLDLWDNFFFCRALRDAFAPQNALRDAFCGARLRGSAPQSKELCGALRWTLRGRCNAFCGADALSIAGLSPVILSPASSPAKGTEQYL